MKEIVVFFLSGKEYGVEVSGMQGFENYVPFTEASDSPEKILGVVTIRDEVIPVVHIKKCLVLPQTEVTGDTKYVVLRTSHGKLAFMVDGVARIFRLKEDDVQECPILIQRDKTNYVDFIATEGQKLVLVLNPESFLTEQEWKYVHSMIDNMEEKDD